MFSRLRHAASVLLAMVLWPSEEARAQSFDVSSTIDSIQFRTESLTPAASTRRPVLEDDSTVVTASASETVPKRFRVVFEMPSTFATNPDKLPGGSDDAVHLTPVFLLNYSGSGGDLGYGLTVSAVGDDFLGGTASDTSILVGKANLGYGDRTRRIAFLASYAPKRIFNDTLGAGLVTLHDLAIGLGRTFTLRGGVTLALDLSYVRREASRAGFQQHQPTGTLALAGPLGHNLQWSLKEQMQGRVFSDTVSLDRRDWNSSTQAELAYPLGDRFAISVVVILEHNESNTAGKSYTAFDVGPKIGFKYAF